MQSQPLKQLSADVMPIDATHVMNVGRWEVSATGPDGKPAVAVIRTTELIVKEGGTWRYLVDHASIGVPPPRPSRRGERERRRR
jgi:ketosteroid isomerase-like protein